MAWRTFLQAHWPALVAADFFTTEVWTARGLVTYYIVFVLELHSRRVQVIGCTPYPDEAFVIQCLWQVNWRAVWVAPRRADSTVRPRSEVEPSGGAVAWHRRHPGGSNASTSAQL